MVCTKCGTHNDDRAVFCRGCGFQLQAKMPGLITGKSKSPIAAVIFSVVVPGLGQFYNNDFKKGLLMMILTVPAMGAVPVTAGVSYLAVWLWSVVNAFRVAKGVAPLWA